MNLDAQKNPQPGSDTHPVWCIPGHAGRKRPIVAHGSAPCIQG
ncbi:hypothetical protein ASZ90_016643 [hydrocarbon metagenome]|uniref:Uncharacterized protein n=1 Tax=hydrocarbon metagenome TaxID=938273 RepID=A0A0W8EL62_9ZZZZ